jgi:hypothetical protein
MLALKIFKQAGKEEFSMKAKKRILTALLLSGSVGLGGQPLFAQSAPGGGSIGPSNPGQTGPTVPQPGPGIPRETQPTIPGQPAPGLPQNHPIPGQPGTIPERVERPRASQERMVVSPNHIKSAQEALKARGHNPGSVNGKMDEKTQQALRNFQKANNLPATGVLDEKTAEQLGVTLTEEGHSIPQSGPDNTMPRSNSVNPRGALQ